jgi:hypothetical protein
MVDGAEVVRDPVLAPVAYEEDVHVAQLAVALGAGAGSGGARRLIELPRLPVRSADRPRDDVLQAAEDRTPFSGGLIEAKAIVFLDARPAPRAGLGHTRK